MTDRVSDYSQNFIVDVNGVKEDHIEGGNHGNQIHIQPENGQMHADYSDAKRSGEIAERILRSIRSEDAGAALPAEMARISAAEIAAVCLGRKPLFHEQIGSSAAEAASSLSKQLPPNIYADSFDGHLSVYNKPILHETMDSDEAFYRHCGETTIDSLRRVIVSGECGELLGYGSRTMQSEGDVLVEIRRGKTLIAGFYTSSQGAKRLGLQRAKDYALYFGESIDFEIHTIP